MDKCEINYEGDSVTVTIDPKQISEPLKGKLSDEDIQKASEMLGKTLAVNDINHRLYRRCDGLSCIETLKKPFRSMPNGNRDADIMLLNKMPTQYEECMMCSHCDTESMFLSLILSKINMDRTKVYCTDMIKCCCDTLDEQSFRTCIDTYLMNEVKLVQPKIIICNGIAVLNTWSRMGYIAGLPDAIEYGTIYDVTIGGLSTKVTAMFDLGKVLQKQGDDLTQCKGKLWIQILNACKSIGG